MKFRILVVVLLLALVGCVKNTNVSDLMTGKTYTLQSLNGNGIIDFTNTEITFSPDGRMFGTGGCNRFNSSYTVEGNKFSAGMIASTKMMCSPAISTQEFKFFEALKKANKIEIKDCYLFLTGEKTKLKFIEK